MTIERISNSFKNITSEKFNLSTGTIVNFIAEFNRKTNAIIESIKKEILQQNRYYTEAFKVHRGIPAIYFN